MKNYPPLTDKSRNGGGYPADCPGTITQNHQEVLSMKRSTSAAITTACVGLAVGGAAYMLSGNNGKAAALRAKRLKRTTGRALRQVGDFLGGVSDAMR
jgi:hypothetical protein